MIRAQTWERDPSVLQAERRRHPRVQAAMQIEIRPIGMDVPMRLETTDVSLGGCYVEMALTLELGTKLDIVLWLGEHKVTTQGVVVTRHPQFGNGIEFLNMPYQHRERLRFFLDSQDGFLQAHSVTI